MNQPTIPRIKRAVAEGFQVSVEDIDSRVRRQPIAIAPPMCILLCEETSRHEVYGLGREV